MIKPGIVRIARDSKLRVQNQVILRGSALPEELVFFCKQTRKLRGDLVRSGLECKQWPVSVQFS